MAKSDPALERLQQEWKEIFQQTLPLAAKAKSSTQPTWPVHLDHCFARIILDSTVGIDTPWTTKIKSPAYMNMSKEQLQTSIGLGRQILVGEVGLAELNNKSLGLRGKSQKATRKSADRTSLGKRVREGLDDGVLPDNDMKKQRTEPYQQEETDKATPPATISRNLSEKEDLTPWIKKIALSQKTDFQKKVLTALCQVPKGQYTTYAAISKHLSSSPRAVGNAVRNNPFAPGVPCHRILASGGGIGGFHGSWGRNGKEGLNDEKKRRLLREEGLMFDGKGNVVGRVWEGFK